MSIRFYINVWEYSCGDTDLVTPKEPPVPGAVLVSTPRTVKEQVYYGSKPIAVLDEDGNPKLEHQKELFPASSNFRMFYKDIHQEGEFWVATCIDRDWEVEFEDLNALYEAIKDLECKVDFRRKVISFGD